VKDVVQPHHLESRRTASVGQRHTVPPLSLLFTLVFLLTTTPAFAQPIKVSKAPPPADQGTALFRGLFHFYGVKPVTDLPERGNRETIVVIFGPPVNAAGLSVELIKTTLDAGGSVLVATDAGGELKNIFEDGETIRMQRGPVICASLSERLGGLQDYPIITTEWPFRSTTGPGKLRLATASPGTLNFDQSPKNPPKWTVGFSGACFRGGQILDADDLFAVVDTGPATRPYRCLVMADQKVFGNQLLYASAMDYNGITPDNFRFANETVKWLAADGTRKQCVFIESGKIQKRFDEFDFSALPQTPPPNLPFPPLPNPLDRPVQEGVAKLIDETIAKLEDDNRFNQPLTQNTRFYGALLGALLLFGLAVATVLFARRVWRHRHSPEYQPLPADPHLLGSDAPLGSFEHRRLELLRGGDFRAPVTAYLRRMFEQRGLSPGAAGRAMPPLEIRSRNRAELKAMIRELWDEAFVFDRGPLPYTRWKEIEPAFAAVKSAADGELWEFRRES